MSKLRSEKEGGKLIVHFPGRMWIVGVFLITLPIYLWLFTDLDTLGYNTIFIYLFIYLLITYVFVWLHHPARVEIDGSQKRITQTDILYVNNPVTIRSTVNIRRIVLVKYSGRRPKALFWAYSSKEEFFIGNQIALNEIETAKMIGQQMADLLQIEFDYQEK